MKRGPYSHTRTIDPPNPSGLCQCGCGQPTQRATMSNVSRGAVAGEYVRFVPGHRAKGRRPLQKRVSHLFPPNPSGQCQCGCGGKTSRARQSDASKGIVKCEFVRFIKNHHGKVPVEYIEEDRGYKTPCWIWQLHIDVYGYGVSSIRSHPIKAHRLYYERVHGPIPDTHDLDHLCRVTSCVNPDHTEPVTPKENQLRKWKSLRRAASIRRLTGKLI